MNQHEEDKDSDDSYWIDAPRMAELAERFSHWCQHKLETESPYRGNRQIVRFLVELISLSSVPVRLIRGKPDYEVARIDRTSLYLAPTPLGCEDELITAWINSEPPSSSDAAARRGLKQPDLRIVSFESFKRVS